MPGTTQELIREAAIRYGVDPALALAVAQQESGFDQSARGNAGEVGVFQLMPGTAADLGVNPYDLAQNIDGGVRYLARQLATFGDTQTALAAYNAGPGNVSRGTIPERAWDYAMSVLSKLGTYAGMKEQPGNGEVAGAGEGYSLASMAPSFETSGWLILAGIGSAALLVLLRRD
jgi:soluble lytic murein transglycosylase-like protein